MSVCHWRRADAAGFPATYGKLTYPARVFSTGSRNHQILNDTPEFLQVLYSGIELFKHIRCATIQSNLNEYQKWCIQIMGVKQRRIALNKPLSFQPTHTLKARRWGKSHTFRKLDVRNTPILCNSLRMLRSIRSDLCGALLAIYHYYCLSVFLPYSCLTLKHHCSESLPVTIDRNHEDSRRAMHGSTVKTVALWQLSTSRMASVHAIRRFH